MNIDNGVKVKMEIRYAIVSTRSRQKTRRRNLVFAVQLKKKCVNECRTLWPATRVNLYFNKYPIIARLIDDAFICIRGYKCEREKMQCE